MTTRSLRTLFSPAALLVGTALMIAPAGLAIADEPAPPDNCEPQWEATVGGKPGVNALIWALTSAARSPDGGSNLYAGGAFTIAGGISTNRIARWDGSNWFPLGEGTNGPVRALAIGDAEQDGEVALYAGGDFSQAGGIDAAHIAGWNGREWSNVGAGTDGMVLAITALPARGDNGPLLIVGGNFTTAGDVAAANIAAWDGTRWSPLGTGFNGNVQALVVHDDGMGDGPAIYAGGAFTAADDVIFNGIAKWDGTTWLPLGSGVDGVIYALLSFDDGTGDGPALYAGGGFTTAGDVNASHIARWDGSAWSAVGSGVAQPVRALAAHDDHSGSGPMLYAGGLSLVDGEVISSRVARWDGSQWSPTDDGFSLFVAGLSSFDPGDGTHPMLYAGGHFTAASYGENQRQEMFNISRWNSTQWQPVGPGFSGFFDLGIPDTNMVLALSTFDDGSGDGESLYAGGLFASIGDVLAPAIAKWDGETWAALGSGMNGTVYDLVTFDDGSGDGPALYAGGSFTTAGGVDARGVAKWDGAQWSPVGSGTSSSSAGQVFALTVFDDGMGDGPALIAGGWFTEIGGVPANYIAKWDGKQWSPLGSGMDDWVWALAVFDDGNGPALYAGGDFTQAGEAAASTIAKWDGTSWTPVGSGTNSRVISFAVFDDGASEGPALYAGGKFSTAGGMPAGRVARWDGEQWSSLGSGVSSGFIHALTTFDDGSGAGRALYAGGKFSSVDGVNANGVARWDGRSWSALGEGIVTSPSRFVLSLTGFDDGLSDAPALYAGGNFETSPAGDRMLAKWQGCAVRAECARGDLNCDGVIDASDLLLLVSAWGACSSCDSCEADLDGDCVVGYSDLLELLGVWGAG